MKIINSYVIIIRSIDNYNLNQEVKLIEFLISIILVLILSLQFTKFISKNAKILYFMAYIIGFLIIVYRLFFIQTVKLPVVISQIERVIAMGAFTGAMFAIVMYTGALDNKKSYTKKLMSIRAELSIIASILFLSHTIPYCVTFFKNISKMDMSQLSTIVYLFLSLTAIICLVIIIPLWITSYKNIRKKMNAKNWKKLQKFAYCVYLLIYAHISFLFLGMGRKQYDKFAIYTIFFGLYFILKIRKNIAQKEKRNNSNSINSGR